MFPSRPPLAAASTEPLQPPDDFVARLAAIGAHPEPSMIEQLGDYLARLLAMNEQMNLTSIVEPAAAWEKHVLDALTLVPLLESIPAGGRVADVGSGGGVPGIPLAICRPDLKFALIEATQKKVAFLADVATALGLSEVSVHAGRAEDLGKQQLHGVFDAVTARAVGKLSMLVPLTAPLVRTGGLLLLVKGQRAEEELTAAKGVLQKHGVVHDKTVATPTGRIVVFRKSPKEPQKSARHGRRRPRRK